MIADNPDKNRGSIRTAKSLVLSIGVYGDAATQGQAAKVFLALDKKDYKGALEAAKGLSNPKADAASIKSIQGKFELDDVMSSFRGKSGGINIEKDMKDSLKAGNIDPKAAELIGSSSALGTYTEKMPNDKAKVNPGQTAKWERWAKEMVSVGKELADEGAKGAKAESKETAIHYEAAQHHLFELPQRLPRRVIRLRDLASRAA